MTGNPLVFDRALIDARKRRLAAQPAAVPDFLLARCVDDLCDRLQAINRPFPLALALGAWTGVLARQLPATGKVGTVIAAESVPALAALCPGPQLVCDEEALPLAPDSLDLVASALSLHLVNDLPGTLIQIRRALKPDGLLLASLLGGRTLIELREAFTLAEAEVTGGASPRVAPFADVRDCGALLQRAGFALPVADAELVTVTYPTPLHLMRELRAMGMANPLRERSRKPLRRDVLMRAVEVYRQRHVEASGRIRASFEIVTLTGWAPHVSQQQPLRPGSAKMRLAEALGTTEHPAGEKAGR
jgi:SAM-dependent methyltransferase